MIVLRDTVLVDIDHTVSNAFWRDPMIGAVPWDEYHAASKDDAPVYDIVHLLQTLKASGRYQLVGFTARPAKWRKLTMEKLLQFECPLDELLMRPDDNFHPAPELKLALVKEYFKRLYDPSLGIAFILDDRADVCAAFHAIGCTALQVYARNPKGDKLNAEA